MKGGEGCRTQSGEAAVSGDAALEGRPPVEAGKSGKNFLGRGGAPDQGEGFYGIVEGGKTPVNPAEGHLELMDQVLGFLPGMCRVMFSSVAGSPVSLMRGTGLSQRASLSSTQALKAFLCRAAYFSKRL